MDYAILPNPYVKSPDEFQDDLQTQFPKDVVMLWMWYNGREEIWENDDPQYSLYTINESKLLTTAKLQGKEGVEVLKGYRVLVEEELQVKIGEEWRQRPVRYEAVCWHWLAGCKDDTDGEDGEETDGEDGEDWQGYSAEIAYRLEAAWIERKPQVPIKAGNGVAYIVDLVKMTQVRADNRHFQRKVRRSGPELRQPDRPWVGSSEYPEYWTLKTSGEAGDPQSPSSSGQPRVVTTPLDPSSAQYRMVEDLMTQHVVQHKSSCGLVPGTNRKPTGFDVVGVDLVQNPHLWTSYKVKQRAMGEYDLAAEEGSQHLQQNPLKTTLLDRSTNEYYLFHGCGHMMTGCDVIEIIQDTGFNNRLSNISGMFGGGLYFADLSSKSNQYVPCTACYKGSIGRDPCKCEAVEKPYRMLLCRVLLGRIKVCKVYREEDYKQQHQPLQQRDAPYDSVLGEDMQHGGDALSFREIVVYDPAQIYPEFVVHYRRKA